MTRTTLTLTLYATFALLATASANDAVWIGPAVGNWEDPANWSTGLVPGGGDNVFVDDNGGQDSLVTVGAPHSINGLTIDEGDQVTVDSDQSLTAAGVVNLHGQLVLNPSARVFSDGPLLIEPTGRLQLLPGSGDAVLTQTLSFQQVLRWNRGLVHGAGVINNIASFLNEGVIAADKDNETLRLILRQRSGFPSASFVNTGTIRAEAGGILRIEGFGARFDNHLALAEGLIEAEVGSGAFITGTTLVGGRLVNQSPSVDESIFEVGGILVGGGTLWDVNTQGGIQLATSALFGDIENEGTLLVANRVDIGNGFTPEGVTTLTGGGVVQLGNPVGQGAEADIRFATSGFDTRELVNEDNTIRGAGRVMPLSSGRLTNRGVIEAVYDTIPLAARITFEQGGNEARYTNSGIIRAAEGHEIEFQAGTWTNYEGTTPGVIEAQPGATISFLGTHIDGGILRSLADIEPPLGGVTEPDGILEIFAGDGQKLTNVRIEGAIGTDNSDIGLGGVIDNTGSLEAARFRIVDDTELRGGGQVIVRGHIERTFDDNNGPITLTNVDNEIRLDNASIQIFQPEFNMTNHGTVVAVQGQSSFLDGTILNAGLLKAETNAELQAGTIFSEPTFGGSALVHADAEATVFANVIVGGRITTAPPDDPGGTGGLVQVNGGIQDVHIEGNVEVLGGNVAGTIQNNGTVNQNGGGIVGVSGIASLEGTGEWRLHPSRVLRIASTTGGSALLFNRADHTIAGSGLIELEAGTLLNEGTINADQANLIIRRNLGTLIQRGTLRSEQNGTLVVLDGDGSDFVNEGRIEAFGNTFVVQDANLVNAAGGEIIVGTELRFDNQQLQLENRQGGRITGNGYIGADLNEPLPLINEGTLAPGLPLGTLILEGPYIQTATGVLEINVEGFDPGIPENPTDGEFGWLSVRPTCCGDPSSVAEVDGEVRFIFDAAVTPELGDALPFLLANEISGRFSSVSGLPALDPELMWTLRYEHDSITAAVANAGDMNADGLFTAADYTIWRDGLGILYDQSHYDAWKANFGSGVGTNANGAVPEPSTATLLLGALLALLNGWRK